jgi:hypothetical protein
MGLCCAVLTACRPAPDPSQGGTVATVPPAMATDASKAPDGPDAPSTPSTWGAGDASAFAPGAAFGSACAIRDDSTWIVSLTLREPQRVHRKALVGRAASLPGTLRCGSGKNGRMYLTMTAAQVRAAYNEHATLSGVAGMGNSSNSCGFNASVDPPTFVPAALLPDVVRGTFDTDEKFDLLHDLDACSANP